MALYWQRRPEYEVFEFTGDVEALETWALAQDPGYQEGIVKRVDPYGTDGFRIVLAWIWDPDGEMQGGQTGVVGDFVVNEWGQLNVRTPEVFHANYEPVTTEPEPGA